MWQDGYGTANRGKRLSALDATGPPAGPPAPIPDPSPGGDAPLIDEWQLAPDIWTMCATQSMTVRAGDFHPDRIGLCRPMTSPGTPERDESAGCGCGRCRLLEA